MTRSGAFRLGATLALVSADTAGAELTGTCRLPPGRVIRLAGLGSVASERSAYVCAWRVAAIDAARVTYRGHVTWMPMGQPPVEPSAPDTAGGRATR